jgi:PGM1 C-terminal domain
LAQRFFIVACSPLKGGTTHPFAVLELLVGGKLDDSGMFYNCRGEPRYYEATDHFYDESLVGVSEHELIERLRTDDIHYNSNTQKGVVFHLFQLLKTYGRIGYTAVGASREEAHSLFDATRKFLKEVGRDRMK